MGLKTKRAKAVRQLKQIKRLISNNDLRLAAEWNKKWHVLISTILSAQTKDETTIKISDKLYKKHHSLKELADAKLKDIKRIIRPINYYKTKARHIKETARIITESYNGRIPKTCEELLKLPGVGRKVANVYLVQAHKAAAIGVDTHLSQTSRKLRWSNNKNPYKIEKDLEKLFPRRYWNKLNYIVVRFGRTYSKKEKDKILNKIKKIKIKDRYSLAL